MDVQFLIRFLTPYCPHTFHQNFDQNSLCWKCLIRMPPLPYLWFWLNVHLRAEFLIKIMTGAHTRVKIFKSCQNIDDWSKYIKQIWSVNILSQCNFWQKNLPHTVKNPVKILMSIFCFNILTYFLKAYGPLSAHKKFQVLSYHTDFVRGGCLSYIAPPVMIRLLYYYPLSC